jgi:hypothetical protein
MAREKFESRLLTGKLTVTCVFQDGTKRTWSDRKENVVEKIISISRAYAAKGYRLTLRQLHYQMVSHDPNYVNHDTAYKKLGKILDDCRYSGVVDWNMFVDRGRKPYLPYWVLDIADALNDTKKQYRLNLQVGQPCHIEVWTEKDALSEIMQRSTSKYHVQLCVNKGYTSSSAIYESYCRIAQAITDGKDVKILYFGDHDPSGLDMVRDIRERLILMLSMGSQLDDIFDADDERFDVIPIGLTMDQIKKYKLPPNPTKMTDTRSDAYVKKFGKTCWEVDALDPDVLTNIIESNIESLLDVDQFNKMVKKQERDKKTLTKLIDEYGGAPDESDDESDDDE